MAFIPLTEATGHGKCLWVHLRVVSQGTEKRSVWLGPSEQKRRGV